MKLFAALLPALLLFPVAAPAAVVPAADDAVFVEGARYDAVLDAGTGGWRLLPATGADLHLRIADHCRAGTAPPPGLWLLSSDALGRPVLLAFSATPLPSGHSGVIPLVGCDAAGAGTLPLPAGLVAWLQRNSGVVYVAR